MKKIGLFLVMFMVLTSLVYAQPLRTVKQTGFTLRSTRNLNDEAGAGVETDTVVWTPNPGTSIVLMGVSYWADTISTFIVETGTTVIIPTTGIGVASGTVVISGSYPLWLGSVDETLTYTTGLDCHHAIYLWGFEE